jgi:hypothetical protein
MGENTESQEPTLHVKSPVVDKLTMGKVRVRLLRISLYRGSPYSYIIWGMNIMRIEGGSSETWSHPKDRNNTMKIIS